MLDDAARVSLNTCCATYISTLPLHCFGLFFFFSFFFLFQLVLIVEKMTEVLKMQHCKAAAQICESLVSRLPSMSVIIIGLI